MYIFLNGQYFYHDALKHLLYIACGKDTWHLIDLNENWRGFPLNLADTCGTIVQASSLKEENYKEWVKQQGACEIWMEPLSWNEMYVIWYMPLVFTTS